MSSMMVQPASSTLNVTKKDSPSAADQQKAAAAGRKNGTSPLQKEAIVGYSYAKCLVGLWAVVLVALCVKQVFYVMGVVGALLTLALLPTVDGDAKMLFPLFLLSERLLVETTSLRHSPVMLFACALFAYAADAGRNAIVSTVYCAVGVGAFWMLTSQMALAIPMGAYVFTALFVYSQLSRAVTLREAIVVAHFAGFFACDAIINVNLNPMAMKELTITSFTHFGGRCALLMGLGVSTVMYLSGIVVPARAWSSAKLRTLVFLVATAALTGFAYAYCAVRFGEDPGLWLLQYVFSSAVRTLALLGWCLGIPLAVMLIAWTNKKKLVPMIIYRKFYHVLAVVAFLPVGIYDPEFLGFSVMLATTLGVLAECARASKLALPGMTTFDAFMKSSIDARDGGSNTTNAAAIAAKKRLDIATTATAATAPSNPTAAAAVTTTTSGVQLIRTHLFLMFGLAMSIILHARQQQMPARPLSPIVLVAAFLLPGVVGLGVMDAAAAACGTIFAKYLAWMPRLFGLKSNGKHGSNQKLSRLLCGKRFTAEANGALGHKSVEGTVGGLFAACVAWAGIVAYLVFVTGIPFYTRAAIPSVVALVCGTLFEAFVDGIDNLELPLFMIGVLQTSVLVLGKFF